MANPQAAAAQPDANTQLLAGIFTAQLQQATTLQQQQQQHYNQDQQRKRVKAVSTRTREWLLDESEKLSDCSGHSNIAVRAYLQALHKCFHRLPQPLPAGWQVDDMMKDLVYRTASGELGQCVEAFLNIGQHRALATYQDVVDHITQQFLGDQERAVLKQQLKSMRLKRGDDDIPRYTRRWLALADEAYPGQRNVNQEQKLADWYMASFHPGPIRDALFMVDPPLATLNAVITAASNLYTRQCKRERLDKEFDTPGGKYADPTHTEMEVDAINRGDFQREVLALQRQLKDIKEDNRKEKVEMQRQMQNMSSQQKWMAPMAWQQESQQQQW